MRKLLLLIVLSAFSHFLDAQDKFRLQVPPSPDAAALGKFGDIPVSQYTGMPQVSIPIYEVIGTHLRLPITLDYHASGVKVEEISSVVGIGWSLNAGGQIARTVNGLSDFKTGSHYNGMATAPVYDQSGRQISGRRIFTDISKFDCMSYDEYGVYANSDDALANIVYEGQADSEPDIFYINMPSVQGKFAFDKNRNIHLNQPVKLDFDFIPVFDNEHWRVVALDGLSYVFGGAGANERTRVDPPPALLLGNPFGNYIETAVTNWPLKRITSPFNEYIEFEYLPYSYSFTTPNPSTYNRLFMESAANKCDVGGTYDYGYTTNIDAQFLKFIKLFNSQNEETLRIEFIPDDTRLDLPGGKKLSRIIVYEVVSSQLHVIKEFLFSYRDDVSNKLWLRSITEVGRIGGGNLSRSTTEFEYYNLAEFPGRTSPDTDYWGYYNGAGNSAFPNATVPKVHYRNDGTVKMLNAPGPFKKKDPSEKFSIYGMLKKIVYPTRGYTEFEYEANEFSNFTLYPQDLGVCSSLGSPCSLPASTDFTITTGGNVEFNNETDVTNASGTLLATLCKGGYGESCNPAVSTYTFYWTDPGSFVKLEYLFKPLTVPNYYWVRLDGPSGTVREISAITAGTPSETWASEVIKLMDIGSYTLTIQAYDGGQYGRTQAKISKIIVRHPTLLKPDGSTQAVYPGLTTLSLSPGKYNLSILNQITSGVKAQVTLNNVNLNVTRNKGGGLRLKKVTDYDGIKFSQKRFEYSENGVTTGKLMRAPATFRYTTDATKYLFNGSTGQIATCHCLYESYSEVSQYPLTTSASGNYVGYSAVSEYSDESGSNGKTVYRYTNFADGPPASQTKVLSDWFTQHSGITYELPGVPGVDHAYENGNLLRQIDYKRDGSSYVPIKEVVNDYEGFYDGANPVTGMKITAWRGGVEPPNNANGTFEANWNPPCEAITYNYYTMSLGWSRLKSRTEYNYEGSNTLQLSQEYGYNANHLLQWSKEVSSDNKDIYTGFSYWQNTNLLQEQWKSYWHHSAEPFEGTLSEYINYLPTKFFVHEPLKSNQLPASETSLGFNSRSNYKLKATNSYDAAGNIVQQERDGIVYAYLWDPRSGDLMCAASNAPKDKIFYTSFESETVNVNTSDSKTGVKSYAAAYTVTLPSAGSYTLSYWKKNGAAWENVRLNNVTSDQVIGGTDTLIDEVRLYPSGAAMTTYTYLIKGTVSSITDQNNITAYYEYDELGRLTLKRDNDRNIVEMFKYNYKQ